MYDQGCDNWVTLCDADFTLESEEASCSYLKKDCECQLCAFSVLLTHVESLSDFGAVFAGDRSGHTMQREHQ